MEEEQLELGLGWSPHALRPLHGWLSASAATEAQLEVILTEELTTDDPAYRRYRQEHEDRVQRRRGAERRELGQFAEGGVRAARAVVDLPVTDTYIELLGDPRGVDRLEYSEYLKFQQARVDERQWLYDYGQWVHDYGSTQEDDDD